MHRDIGGPLDVTMTDRTDQDLLRDVAEGSAEAAFEELTRRHLDLVYGVAFRVTGDPEAAKDVAQTVFMDLARKAARLRSDVVLPAWLYRAAAFAAAKACRHERRRLSRETEAMRQHQLLSGPDEPDDDLLPFLDDALGRLPEADRSALILRFLSRQDLRTVGNSLGVSEDAARKRVDRALERLRTLLAREGRALPVSTLVLGLGVIGSQTAPPALAATVVAAGLSAAAMPAVATVAFLPIKVWVGVLGIALVGWTIYQETTLRSLRRTLEDARAAQQASQPVEAPAPTPAPVPSQSAELAHLRSQAAVLRGRLSALPAPARGEPQATSPVVLVAGVEVALTALEEAGSASPEAAVQSALAALQRGDLSRFLELTVLDQEVREAQERELAEAPAAAIALLEAATEAGLRGETVQLMGVLPDGPERAVLEVRLRHPGRNDRQESIVMGRSTAGWRYLPISVSTPGK